jgi:hypothetical protein
MKIMKRTFKLTLVLLILSTTLVAAAGAEYTKNFRKGWTKSSVSALKITNKFGEVKINDLGGDSVTIKVVITVDNFSESKARDLLNKIHIDFQKNGNLASAETKIDNDFRSKQSFSIDYLVNIPKDKDLDISNRYGNVIVSELEAKGVFTVDYGSFSAGKIKVPAGNPVKIVVSYGKADLETVNDADMEFKYSKLYADEIGHLMLDTKYSTVNLHKVGSLTLDSKYDVMNLDEVDQLKAVSRYTNYKIDKLVRNFNLDTGYGSVRISKVDPKFEQIRITNSYGGIAIGLNELNYKLKADCDYCEINYPTDRYKGNKIKDNHQFSLEGSVGNGGGNVSISSRYGGVKLME